ncbi:hypothetical protein DFH07DRAFT_768249 [Mycena maculata]|uniref:SAP domain-containing protein n=1 Tax=Mycena maculata TaxID=230809 RepID=A0AAD7JV38_9AGAR|nr:hypothetical protein DFH07DRAFT_768249 [Mycena maculata]
MDNLISVRMNSVAEPKPKPHKPAPPNSNSAKGGKPFGQAHRKSLVSCMSPASLEIKTMAGRVSANISSASSLSAAATAIAAAQQSHGGQLSPAVVIIIVATGGFLTFVIVFLVIGPCCFPLQTPRFHLNDDGDGDNTPFDNDSAPPYDNAPLYDYDDVIDIQGPVPSYSPPATPQRAHVNSEESSPDSDSDLQSESPPHSGIELVDLPRHTRSRAVVVRPTSAALPLHIRWPRTLRHSDDSLTTLPPPAFLPLYPPPMPRADEADTRPFPIPGTYNRETERYETVVFNLQTTNVRLKEQMTKLGMKASGLCKADMVKALRDFSANPASWHNALEPGARNAHRNRRPGTQTAKTKASTKRREILLATIGSNGEVLPRRPTDRSRDDRPRKEIDDTIAWANTFTQAHPYQPKAARNPLGIQNAETRNPQMAPISLQAHMQQSSVKFDQISDTLVLIVSKVVPGLSASAGGSLAPELGRRSSAMGLLDPDPFARLPSTTGCHPIPGDVVELGQLAIGDRDLRIRRELGPYEVISLVGARRDLELAIGGDLGGSCLEFGLALSVGRELGGWVVLVVFGLGLELGKLGEGSGELGRDLRVPFWVIGPLVGARRIVNCHRLAIGERELLIGGVAVFAGAKPDPRALSFTEEDIPDTKVLSFLGPGPTNVAAFAALWSDDPGSTWHTHPDADTLKRRLPILQGYPIAIKHWPSLYHYLQGPKFNTWNTIKAKWTDYKFLYDHWEHFPDDDTFWQDFNDDEPPTFAMVILILRSRRRLRDEADSAKAYREYGPPESPRFKEHFTRAGAQKALIDQVAVAKRYRELVADQAKRRFGTTFKDDFVYNGRQGRTVMTRAEDIAKKFETFMELYGVLGV